MSFNKTYLILSVSLLVLSCNKILRPITGGHDYSKYVLDSKNSKYSEGTTIYLEPDNNLKVRAIEKCQIQAVVVSPDSAQIIVAKGKFEVGYGNLKKYYVSKGEWVKKGQIIGELFSKDSALDNYLSISLKKDGRYFNPGW